MLRSPERAENLTKGSTILDYLVRPDVNRCNVDVYVASYVDKDEETPVFQRLTLTVSLTGEFRSVIAGAVEGWWKEREGQQLVLWPHLIGTMPQSYEVEYIDLNMYDSIKKQVEALAQPLIGLSVFTADDKIVSGIRFYLSSRLKAPGFRHGDESRVARRRPVPALDSTYALCEYNIRA